MAKFLQATFVVAVAFAACNAEPARFSSRTNRFFARQEVASENAAPAKAPYPPAGLKPDIPFDLPTETTTAQPDNTYLPPDSTYGPPTTAAPTDATTTEIPDVLLVDDDDTESVISVAVSYDNDNVVIADKPQRIVFGQRTQPLQRSQKLRTVRAEPIFLDDGSFAYSAQVQNW